MKQPSYLSPARLNRLRAAVLGANDGIISTASLVMGVTGAGADNKTVFIAGVAALAAGAFSMAVGEYVSVASQKDAEMANKRHDSGEYTSPTQAAVASFISFGLGGIVPILAVILSPDSAHVPATIISVIVALLVTGYASATAGKASRPKAMARILIGGILAMTATYGVGVAFGTFI